MFIDILYFRLMYSWANDDEEEEDETLEDKYGGKHLIIFLVDATKRMASTLIGDLDGLTGIQRALMCAHASVKSKIFHSDSDCVGVLTFGNKNGQTKECDFQNLRQILPLARPSSEAILSLEELTNGDEGAALFESRFGSGDIDDVFNF